MRRRFEVDVKPKVFKIRRAKFKSSKMSAKNTGMVVIRWYLEHQETHNYRAKGVILMHDAPGDQSG